MGILDNTKFRKLNLDGLKILVSWALKEGWNPGPLDAEVFYGTDPDGFYGVFIEDVLIAGGSVVSYNQEFGFMGFFIVKPEYRSLGIGKKLWYLRRDLLISRLNNGASIGMDGVLTMQPFYQKGGFKIAFKDIRYEKTGCPFTTDENISPITDNDFNELLRVDKKYFGFERSKFLKSWLKLPHNRTFKYIIDGTIKGYAIVRKVDLGFKVCPLFAEDEKIAEELYKACLNSVIGHPLYLDVPTINKNAMHIVSMYDAHYVFECARMYYGNAPNIDMNKVYGITTFELG